MGSVNNWLGFSLSPNMTVELQDSSQSQSASAVTVATSSMVHSSVADPSNMNIGFGSRDCFSHNAHQAPPPPMHMHIPPEMTLRSDGSLYILDSINRSQNEDWHLKNLEQTRSMQDAESQQHLISADLSMLVGGRSDHMCSDSRYDHNMICQSTNNNNRRHDGEGPKLEDFLGGASLGGGGGQYSESRTSEISQPSANLNDMYGTAAPSFNDGDMKSSFMSDSARLNCFHAFDIADSELSATNSSKRSDDQHSIKAESLSGVSAIHSLNLRDSYDHNSNEYIFPECTLQLPQTSGVNNNNINGLSMIKTWLRTQPTSSSAESKMTNTINTNYGNGASCSTITTTTTATNPEQPKEGMDTLTNIQSLKLSMSPTSQSTTSLAIVPAATQNGTLDTSLPDSKKRLIPDKPTTSEPATRKSIDTFGQRTSIYRGVTRHRWTGRYEAHLWDNSCRREGQTRKGRQVYLGGYDKEEKAARAYDLAALKYWGPTTTTNFPISNYEKELEEMKHMTRQEYVASLRRKSSGFSRGASMYRGVTRHHQHGRWQARIGRVAGNKDLYLGTFSTQEEAAEAYDIAAIKFRGLNAVTNFDMSRYDVKSILASSTLPVGGHVKRIKEAEPSDPSVDGRRNDEDSSTLSSYATSNYSNATNSKTGHEWPLIAFQNHANQQRGMWCKQEVQQNQPQDFQVQLHSLHNQKFFQPSLMTTNATVLHNLMTLQESPSVDSNSAGSTSGLFTNISANNLAGSGLLMASNTPTMHQSMGATDNQTNRVSFGQSEQGSLKGNSAYESMNLYGDPYSRGVYYLPQQQQQQQIATGTVKAGNYDSNAAAYNNWMTTAPAQALAQRPNGLTVCHAPIFSIWNDS